MWRGLSIYLLVWLRVRVCLCICKYSLTTIYVFFLCVIYLSMLPDNRLRFDASSDAVMRLLDHESMQVAG